MNFARFYIFFFLFSKIKIIKILGRNLFLGLGVVLLRVVWFCFASGGCGSGLWFWFVVGLVAGGFGRSDFPSRSMCFGRGSGLVGWLSDGYRPGSAGYSRGIARVT